MPQSLDVGLAVEVQSHLGAVSSDIEQADTSVTLLTGDMGDIVEGTDRVHW